MIVFQMLTKVTLLLLIFFIINYLINNIKFIKLKLYRFIEKSKFAKLINLRLIYLDSYGINFRIKNQLTSVAIIIASSIFSLVIYFFSIVYIKIFTTSLILCIVAFFTPYFLISLIINAKIQKVKMILPSYIVNLKSNIEVNNNIVKAISITRVEEPIKSNIDIFNLKVNRGINIYQCFDELKTRMNISTFNSLIDAFKVCYQNGGDYINVFNKYIDITTKENVEKAKLKENGRTTIITLIIMILINIFLLFSVVLSNAEYRQIILNTTIGHVIINFQILSYLLVIYFVYKVYKMEE